MALAILDLGKPQRRAIRRYGETEKSEQKDAKITESETENLSYPLF
jgi:hypothetical protein